MHGRRVLGTSAPHIDPSKQEHCERIVDDDIVPVHHRQPVVILDITPFTTQMLFIDYNKHPSYHAVE